MEIYHVGDTYPPIDFLLERGDDKIYVDPSLADSIEVKVKINGSLSTKLSVNLTNNVSIVVDDGGFNRVRIRFVEGDLDTAGIYQLQVILTWANGEETSPIYHQFKVVPAWT